MLQFKKISHSTILELKLLLYQRNQTLPEYVEWKYGVGSPDGFRGLIAFEHGNCVGCFGSVPIKIQIDQSDPIEVGWFSDWFVIPEMRRSGLGRTLLEKLTEGTQYFFGHPGPRNALRICLESKWQPLAYQAKKRWILNIWPYYRQRTRHPIKAIAQITISTLKNISSKYFIDLPEYQSHHVDILFTKDQFNWFTSQPSVCQINRRIGEWHSLNINIHYMDDYLPTRNEIYRRITWIEPLANINCHDIHNFISESRVNGISFIDVLCGSPRVAKICALTGAITIKESPIVCHGFSDAISLPNLQGIHRENWLFMAAKQ